MLSAVSPENGLLKRWPPGCAQGFKLSFQLIGIKDFYVFIWILFPYIPVPFASHRTREPGVLASGALLRTTVLLKSRDLDGLSAELLE
jgi:hypothetical protein